jgi:hypothetical protein
VTAKALGVTAITATTLDGDLVASTIITVTNGASSPQLTWTQHNRTELVLSWPADHRGWLLQVQTNALGSGLGSNWVTVPGSALILAVTNAIGPANGGVFYRLTAPN